MQSLFSSNQTRPFTTFAVVSGSMDLNNLTPIEALNQLVELKKVINKNGLIYSERGNLSNVFTKPKLLPIMESPERRRNSP